MPYAQVAVPSVPADLLGPLGLLVGALIVVGVLWRLVREYINSLIARAVDAERRAAASDARLDRIATAFERATKSSAPE